MKITTKTLMYILLVLGCAHFGNSQSQNCPPCEYADTLIRGTQEPGKECVCVKLVFVPQIRICSITTHDSSFECFDNAAPTIVLATQYMGFCPDCSGCLTADYTSMGTKAVPEYECYTNDTDCGGNG